MDETIFHFDSKEKKEELIKFLESGGKEIHYSCNEKLDNVFVNSQISVLCFFNKFKQSCDFLPLSLTELYFHIKVDFPLGFLPASLKKIYISNLEYDIINLPANLESLTISKNRNNHKIFLPSNLKILHDYSSEYFSFPNSLEELVFQCLTNNIVIPKNIKKLHIELDHIEEKILLPDSIEELSINGSSLCKDINIEIPKKLQKLYIRTYGKFNKIIEQLPESLEYLKIKKYKLYQMELTISSNEYKMYKFMRDYGSLLPKNLKQIEID